MNDNYHELRAFIRLWQMVILQALYDLAGIDFGDEDKIGENEKMIVKDWIFIGNKNFYEVCDYAGYHPDMVRKAAHHILTIGYRRCAPIGKGKRYLQNKLHRMKTGNFGEK